MAFEKIPVSILTGFLGAGKSTLLNRLLKDPAMSDAAIIINEFGDVSIDHLLVERSGDGIIELAEGCLCCTVRGELVDSVREAFETSGKAVTFGAATVLASAVFWLTSSIRFNADMGLLLGIWMVISCLGWLTLMPTLIVLFKPQFIMKEANRPLSRGWAMDNSTPI